eukprot:163879-Hanusia_phi.AAC.1
MGQTAKLSHKVSMRRSSSDHALDEIGANKSHELTWNDYEHEEDLDEYRDGLGDGLADGRLTSLEEEVLIGSLLDSEDIGPAVRAVYERGAQTSLLTSLDGIVDQKDEEILGLCGQESALDFIRSVEAIVSIRDHAQEVGDSIVSVNEELQSEVRRPRASAQLTMLLRQGTELLAAQEQVRRLGVAVKNIDSTHDALVELQRSLQMICTIKKFLDQKKLLSALKSFQQLQASWKPACGISDFPSPPFLQALQVTEMRSPSFGRLLERQLPIQAERIRSSCLMEFNKWISQLRVFAQPVGKAAMQAMQESSVLEDEALQLANRNTHVAQGEGEGEDRMPRLALAAMRRSARSSALIDFRKVGVDMGSLLQCLHIFRELGQLPTLRSHFREARRSHARIDHVPPKDFVLNISGDAKPNSSPSLPPSLLLPPSLPPLSPSSLLPLPPSLLQFPPTPTSHSSPPSFLLSPHFLLLPPPLLLPHPNPRLLRPRRRSLHSLQWRLSPRTVRLRVGRLCAAPILLHLAGVWKSQRVSDVRRAPSSAPPRLRLPRQMRVQHPSPPRVLGERSPRVRQAAAGVLLDLRGDEVTWVQEENREDAKRVIESDRSGGGGGEGRGRRGEVPRSRGGKEEAGGGSKLWKRADEEGAG